MRGGLPVTPSASPLPSAAVPEPTAQDKEAEDDSISIGIQALELRVRNVYTGRPLNCLLVSPSASSALYATMTGCVHRCAPF